MLIGMQKAIEFHMPHYTANLCRESAVEVQWNDCTLHAVKSLHSIAGNICKYCSNLNCNFYYFSNAIFTCFRCNFYFCFAAISTFVLLQFLSIFQCLFCCLLDAKNMLSHCLLRRTRIFQKFF